MRFLQKIIGHWDEYGRYQERTVERTGRKNLKITEKRKNLQTANNRLQAGFCGGDAGIWTLAPAEPTYRISNPDPSAAWVHLRDHNNISQTMDFRKRQN